MDPTRNPIARNARLLIGMVHTHALPGSPFARESLDEIAKAAAAEARMLKDTGFDGLILENMHDRPFVNHPHADSPATTAAMTRVALEVRAAVGGAFLMGIQILSRGERQALAVALACGASFIRCENFVFAHVADEGLMPDAAAGPLLRYRRTIGAEHIAVYADLKKKHASHAITADTTLAQAAQAADFFSADGVIVTGTATGQPADLRDVAEVRRATQLPVLVGSGVTPPQVKPLLGSADALIVGSYIKQGGVWSNPVDPVRCREIVNAR
jgi:membrane complex biogenesis BtpA family protein